MAVSENIFMEFSQYVGSCIMLLYVVFLAAQETERATDPLPGERCDKRHK